MVTTESEVRYAARYAPLQFSTESAATTKSQTRGLLVVKKVPLTKSQAMLVVAFNKNLTKHFLYLKMGL